MVKARATLRSCLVTLVAIVAPGVLCTPMVMAAPPVSPAVSDSAERARAQVALREGNALLEQGRPEEALRKFIEAHRLFPSPKLHYNIGQAEGLLAGHEARAYQAFSRFLDEAKDAHPDLRTAAGAYLQQHRNAVALVAVSATPSDAGLTIDGEEVGSVQREIPVVLGRGTHQLTLRKGSSSSAPQTINVAGGETVDLRLDLNPPADHVPATPPGPPARPARPAPLAVAPPVPTPPPTAPPVTQVPVEPAPSGWSGAQKVAIGLAAAAVVGLLFGVTEHAVRESRADEFGKAGCGTADLSIGDCRSRYDGVHSAQRWAVIGYVSAAVLGGAGAYLFWLSPSERLRTGGEGGSAAALGDPGLSLTFRGRF